MPTPAPLTSLMISKFCHLGLANALEAEEREIISRYLTDLLDLMAFPPYRGRLIDWAQVALSTGIDHDRLQNVRQQLSPIFDAVTRAAMRYATPKHGAVKKEIPSPDEPASQRSGRPRSSPGVNVDAPQKKKRGPKPRPIVEFPEPLWVNWTEPDTLSETLILHMRRHGDPRSTVKGCGVPLDSLCLAMLVFPSVWDWQAPKHSC